LAAVGPGESAVSTGIWLISILGGNPRKLRDNAGRAAVSPSGAHIAFIAARSQSEIWLMDADGENSRKLLQAAAGDRFLQVQWSPGEQRLAYIKAHTEGDSSQMTIESVPVSGGTSTTILPASAGLGSFCWSSDGRIIYSLAEPPPNSSDMNLWELRVDSSGKPAGSPRRITSWAGLSVVDLSLSADAKRLVLVKAGLQRDLYLAEIKGNTALGAPRRFNLQGRDDLPSAWTPDGQRLFFYSDRNGNWDIFRQGLQERKAQDFIVGPGDQTQPRLSPDGQWLLYWDLPDAGNAKSVSMQLMRIPVSGGVPEKVLQARHGSAVHCSPQRAACILGEPDPANGELIFTSFDPATGRTSELIRVAADLSVPPAWDLSPDGSSIAIVGLDEQRDRIRVIEVDSGSARTIAVGHSAQLEGISWSADGKGWFLSSSSLREAALLYASSTGSFSELWTTSTAVGTPLASPDGRNIAFTVSASNSNAWMVENF
jgi:Tol biopolymer transport system component